MNIDTKIKEKTVRFEKTTGKKPEFAYLGMFDMFDLYDLMRNRHGIGLKHVIIESYMGIRIFMVDADRHIGIGC